MIQRWQPAVCYFLSSENPQLTELCADIENTCHRLWSECVKAKSEAQRESQDLRTKEMDCQHTDTSAFWCTHTDFCFRGVHGLIPLFLDIQHFRQVVFILIFQGVSWFLVTRLFPSVIWILDSYVKNWVGTYFKAFQSYPCIHLWFKE